MGDRTSHDAGTISWSDLATSDQEAAKEFYAGLFGWEYDEQPIDDDTTYSMGKLGDRTAAAISPQQSSETEQGIPPHWNVYVTVDDVAETTGKVEEAGGNVLAGPFDVFNAGKMSVIADPTGAVLCLWQAGDSIWSRPALRLFATYAKWDEKWGYNKDNSGDLTTFASADTSGNGILTNSRGKDDEVTFGAQMEIWW